MAAYDLNRSSGFITRLKYERLAASSRSPFTDVLEFGFIGYEAWFEDGYFALIFFHMESVGMGESDVDGALVEAEPLHPCYTDFSSYVHHWTQRTECIDEMLWISMNTDPVTIHKFFTNCRFCNNGG